jgi:hypothetical protein
MRPIVLSALAMAAALTLSACPRQRGDAATAAVHRDAMEPSLVETNGRLAVAPDRGERWGDDAPARLDDGMRAAPRGAGLPIAANLGFRAAAAQANPVMPAARHIDANGNGASDLFFFNHSTGGLVTWYMNGTTRTAYSTSAIPGSRRVVGTGIFSGDHRDDLLLADADGTLYLGISNGATFAEQRLPYTSASRAIAAGDFDGNGKSDILLLDGSAGKITTWYMVDGNRVAYTSQTLPAGLRFVTVGDFNGDLLDDLLFEGPQGALYMAISHGAAFQMRALLSHDTSYTVRAATDVNGDRQADILLHSATANRLVVWYMDGLTRLAYNSSASPAGAVLVASGDFDHDGRGDVGWAQAQGGAISLSLSTGYGFATSLLPYTFPAATSDPMDIEL